MSHTVDVAIVQAEISPTLAEGLERTDAYVSEAAANGAQLVVFPETWLPGYPIWLDVCRDVALWDYAPVKAVYEAHAEQSVDVHGSGGAELSRIALTHGVTMVVGVTERVSSGHGRGTLYNTLLTYGPDGQLLNHHRKLIPTYTERIMWGQGDSDGLCAVETQHARVGGLICWEHWMPLARQALHESGEDIHVAAWPTVHEAHHLASRQYAFEGRCYVLACGSLARASSLPPGLEPHPDRVRNSHQWLMSGGSAIIGPDGGYVVEPVYEAHAILQVRLDLAAVRMEQMTLDVAGHYSRPDCFDFTVKRGKRSGRE